MCILNFWTIFEHRYKYSSKGQINKEHFFKKNSSILIAMCKACEIIYVCGGYC